MTLRRRTILRRPLALHAHVSRTSPGVAAAVSVALVILVFVAMPAVAQTGHFLSAAGPTDYSIAGASTAMPLDASGALYWNPASLMGLSGSELDVGVLGVFPTTQLSSRVAPGAFGFGVPPIPLAGVSNAKRNPVLTPDFSIAWRPARSRWAYGVALTGVAGFGVDYARSPSNPVTTPPPPVGLGFGRIYSEYRLWQVTPAFAYRLGGHFSVGIAPLLLVGSLAATPLPFGQPDDANSDGFATYPSATEKQHSIGGGVQAGVYYGEPKGVHVGLAFKSRQTFQAFDMKATDELGRPRSVSTRIDAPMVVSLGLGYSGAERFAIAADVRYVDYDHTAGFEGARFDARGALNGLGWDRMIVAAIGGQVAPEGPVSLRGGYSYNTNPIHETNAFVNVASPAINQHTVYAGISIRASSHVVLSGTYGHGFETSVSGPIATPAGFIPGTTVTSTLSTQAAAAGLRVLF